MAVTAFPGPLLVVVSAMVKIVAQTSPSDVPGWLDLGSTAGLAMALGYLVFQLSKGELVSRGATNREQKLTEAFEMSTEVNQQLIELIERSGEREDRLFTYLEQRSS